MTPSSFLWFLHQPSSADWLKRELAARRADLRFAFSRPGLTTFKVDASRTDDPVASSFARAHGRSLGRATDVAAVQSIMATLDEQRLRLHVFERDPDMPAEDRDANVAGRRARDLEQALRAALPGRFHDDVIAKPDDRVLDVICAPAEHPDDGWLVGWHTHDATRGPFPGGVNHARIPDKAPSRAWAKIEEAIRWSGLQPRVGEHAVELGSAPGGASFALLERGLNVHGVDPGAMAESVLSYRGPRGNRFVHHRVSAASVEKRDLPHRFEWLASDMNLAPMVALRYVERFVALAHGGLRGAFITLKLNDEGIFDALPVLRERIAKLGATDVRYTQLPSHRSELVAILSW